MHVHVNSKCKYHHWLEIILPHPLVPSFSFLSSSSLLPLFLILPSSRPSFLLPHPSFLLSLLSPSSLPPSSLLPSSLLPSSLLPSSLLPSSLLPIFFLVCSNGSDPISPKWGSDWKQWCQMTLATSQGRIHAHMGPIDNDSSWHHDASPVKVQAHCARCLYTSWSCLHFA